MSNPRDPLSEALDAEPTTVAANDELRREAAGLPTAFVAKGADAERGADGFEVGKHERRTTENR